MALKIYNTLSREIELFEPLKPPHVGLYTCGPTVYNYLHIGNWRAYIFTDLLKRYLQYKDYEVLHVMNITDVEDKIIREVNFQNKSLKDLTEFYTTEFFKDRDTLNILPADTYTKATDYISKMIVLIERLMDKGYAYKTDDGSVYFDIKKDKSYGKLSHFKLSDLKQNAKGRLKNDEYEKENAEDFALWKSWTKEDGNVYWETSLGKGRPGWHIECSTMSMDTLGESFDIHTGGVDNIFPHHENEIAQSECATGKTFAKYFMHNEHLMVNAEKMAKSKGNFYTLQDLVGKGIDPLAFRLWLYTAHYKTKTNFTIETIEGSQVALNRIKESYLNLGEEIGSVDITYKNKFMEFMDHDLDTPKALTVFGDLIKDKDINNSDKKATILDMDKVLGFGLESLKEEIIPDEIITIAKQREEARQNKDWTKSDELRKQIEELGYEIKDSTSGYKISKRL
jgi:cysteinyl-tRNA synthetase